MKAVQVVKPGEMKILDIEKPVIDEHNNVLVKMTAAGICGSDRGIYHGTNAAATYPRIIGHEMVGVVDEIGPDVKNLKVGDRVIINQVISCGHCYPCSLGRGNVCDNLKVRGVHVDGGYREYIAVPEVDCYILPDSLADTDAVMIEPTTIAIQSCARAELKEDDMLLIMGAGALGSTILKIARLTCKHIIVADIQDEKLEEAKENGAMYTINSLKEDLVEKVKGIYTRTRKHSVNRRCVYERFPDHPVKGNRKCRTCDDNGILDSSDRGESVPDHIKRAGCERLQTSEQNVREGNRADQ